MRDVSAKSSTLRTAVACATLRAKRETIVRVESGDLPKGDALAVARVAGVQAAKQTSALIPYCHPVPIEHVEVRFEFDGDAMTVFASVKSVYKTGVEMEALTAASVAALTVYDMTKMIDDDAVIESVRLIEKRGGKSDFAPVVEGLTASVITVSDSRSRGDGEDRSGPAVKKALEEFGLEVLPVQVVSDDVKEIERAVLAAEGRLIILTGGTGVGPRDNTPEAVRPLLDKEMPGVAEQMRRYGQDRMPMSMVSRSVCGTMGERVVICLPGSPGGAVDGLRAVLPHLLHVLAVVKGAGHAEAPR